MIALVVVLALLAVAGVKVRSDRERARLSAVASAVVRDYLQAWSRGDATGAARLVVPSAAASAAALLAATRQQWHASTATFERVGPVRSTGRPGAEFRATVQVAGLGTARWTGTVPLVRVGSGWGVAFTPAAIHPALVAGGRFSYSRERPHRGRLLTADGAPLSVDTDLDGNLRGQVVTAKVASGPPPGVQPGDLVGSTGLERAFNTTLAGQAGGALAVIGATGQPVASVLTVAKVDGKDLRTTIDLRTQRAGEAALAGLTKPAALVAVDVRTGRLLAAVNQPAVGFGRAVAGKGPPGSTFKIITSTAALMAGVPPTTVLDCSRSTSINGRTFTNAENHFSGPIGWRQAFAESCNTWFVRLQQQVPIERLRQAAELFGFATGPDSAAVQQQAGGVLPIRSFGGSYPTPRDRAQAAGQALGQDLVLASPLQMASVAAAVAAGTWRKPVVVGSSTVTHQLPSQVVSTLRSFMAAVPLAGGTAANAGLPAGTFGKTGTAETAASVTDPKLTDSWFVGYRGSIAFAVEVDRGGFGADVAAPAAARFLRALG